MVEKADLLDDVDPQLWLGQLAADLEDQLPELVHHHFGKLFVVDLGSEKAHGVGEAAEKLRAEFGKVGHKELVQPHQEQLQGRDVMLRLVTICLAHCELHLYPDVLKDWQEDQPKDLTPQAVAKVLMMRLQGRTEGIDRVVADRFILLHDQASEVAEDWEPQLLHDAELDGLGVAELLGLVSFKV